MTHRPCPPRLVRSRAACGLVLLWLALPLTACSSGETTMGLLLVPNARASLTVEGSNPFVVVNNSGPGEVNVLFKAAHLPADGPHRLIRGSVARTLRDGGAIELSNDSTEKCDIMFTIERSTGTTLDQQPAAPPAKQ
ncbi:MAG: hypothetical protein IT430_18000 [Phycisphaerales bacterium]|nr:hypothetical protein [Phycisphaerales bacterium]